MNIIETNLKFNSNHSTRSGNPPGIVLHHAAANGSVQDVHNWHLANGWAGIGYHFYVRKDGSIYRGRPENWIGSHTSGHNSKIGICAEGNFDVEQMGAAQKNAIIELLDYLYEKYGKLKVYGHRDLDATACPGENYPFNDIVNGKKDTGEKPDVKPNNTNKEVFTMEMRYLRKGSKGKDVKALQILLKGYGYSVGWYGADGDFGNATESAVKKFQAAEKIAVDGVVGPDTWSHLLK